MVLKMIVKIKRLRKDLGIYVTHEEEDIIYIYKYIVIVILIYHTAMIP